MKHAWLPTYFGPRSVILIDDDASFLESTAIGLLQHNINSKTFTDPRQALQHIEVKYNPNSLARGCLSTLDKNAIEGEEPGDFAIKVDTRKLKQILSDSNRFDDFNVVVVDYAMHGSNGLEFAQAIRKSGINVKIIMLTGQANAQIGIEGLTSGVLDHFLMKNEVNILDQLAKSINQLSLQSFQEHSLTLNTLLSTQDAYALNDSACTEFFYSTCKANNITEYCLLDKDSTFLLLDLKGKPYLLSFFNAHELEEQYSALADEPEVTEHVKNHLNQKSHTLCFSPYRTQYPEFSTWDNYLFPLQEISDDLYAMLVKDMTPFAQDIGNIANYYDYLSEL